MNGREISSSFALAAVASLGALVISCAKPSNESAAIATNSATPSASSAAAPRASSGPSAEPSSAPQHQAHLGSLQVCNLVVDAGIAKVCEHKPSPTPGSDASQFTIPATPARKVVVYGGVFVYATEAEYRDNLGKFRSDTTKKNGVAPLILSNDKALTIVGVDGEMSAEAGTQLKSIVDKLQ